MSDDDDKPEAEPKPATDQELGLLALCVIAAEIIGYDAVMEMLDRHVYGGTVH